MTIIYHIRRLNPKKLLIILLVVGLVYGVDWLVARYSPQRTAGIDRRSHTAADSARNAEIANIYRERISNVWIQAEGEVMQILPDDRTGTPHQRFIMRLASGQTLLISHNLDLAHRVPLRQGGTVRVRGEYLWNEQGGIMHWTHDDPRGRRAGGWIEWRGKKYH